MINIIVYHGIGTKEELSKSKRPLMASPKSKHRIDKLECIAGRIA